MIEYLIYMLPVDRQKPAEVREQEIIAEVFPFGKPSKEVVRGTYFINDEELCFGTGFHQTDSTILLFPRTDGRLLVPAAALGDHHPSLNLGALMRDGLPETHRGSRRVQVWLGRTILKFVWNNTSVYSPAKAEDFISTARGIQALYQSGLSGKSIDREKLGHLFSKVIGGFWWQHYVNELSDEIELRPKTANNEVQKLFIGFEDSVTLAANAYKDLDNARRQLVDKAFKFIIRTNTTQPILYSDDEIPSLLNGNRTRAIDAWRDPLEIIGDSRGVRVKDVQAVYLPNEIEGSNVDRIATNRLLSIGLPQGLIRRVSDMQTDTPVYDNCLQRYGKFNAYDLLTLIQERKLVPILNSN